MNLHHLRHGWFLAVFLFCAVVFFFNLLHWLIFRVLRRKQSEGIIADWGIQQYLGHPSRAIFLLTCFLIVLPIVPALPGKLDAILHQAGAMAIIAALGWFAVGCIYIFQAGLMRKYDISAANNMRARSIHTQFQLVRRVAIAFIVILTAGALLWTFDDPRILHYGSGLLASAGIASLILATAAKSTAANLLAGIQIAFTEPIRIDDVVVIQGEWGKIEEITSAYVVVQIWDLRRLIVPLSYLIENSFQNWTRHASDILGTAFLYVDYSIPIEDLRQQLDRIVHPSPLWDGKVCGLQVTNLSERTMELRCLVSSPDAGQNFDLRCNVREQMTVYIQQHYPNAFPLTRLSALPGSALGSEPVGPGSQSPQ